MLGGIWQCRPKINRVAGKDKGEELLVLYDIAILPVFAALQGSLARRSAQRWADRERNLGVLKFGPTPR